MKIISLSSSIAGPACAITFCIKRHFYNNNYLTNIFDFLEISLKSIIEILNIYCEKLDIENELRKNYKIILNHEDKNSVFFNNFDKMISHHDLKKNYDTKDFNEFIEKYKRRYYRLIDYIITENKLFFIRFDSDTKENIIDFMNIIYKINPNIKVYFINLYYEKNDNLSYNIQNYYYINFFHYIDYTKKYNDNLFYKLQEFDWKYVYEIIIQNLDNTEKLDYYIKNS